MTITTSISRVNNFKRHSLTETIAEWESELAGADKTKLNDTTAQMGLNREVLMAAVNVKKASAQINVVIHAVGILYALPFLLIDGEKIEELSIGAGSTGGGFDLVTNQRIAEFKFSHWQGGSGSVSRKKSLFQDFYKLAREDTTKEKYLYLLNTEIPLRFLQGRRQIRNALNKSQGLLADFEQRYGGKYSTVGDFYADFRTQIKVVDLKQRVPGFDAVEALYDK